MRDMICLPRHAEVNKWSLNMQSILRIAKSKIKNTNFRVQTTVQTLFSIPQELLHGVLPFIWFVFAKIFVPAVFIDHEFFWRSYVFKQFIDFGFSNSLIFFSPLHQHRAVNFFHKFFGFHVKRPKAVDGASPKG